MSDRPRSDKGGQVSGDRTARDQAVEFLLTQLAGGPVPATAVRAAASEAGISDRTLDRAKKPANVRARKLGTGWVWELDSATPGKDAIKSANVKSATPGKDANDGMSAKSAKYARRSKWAGPLMGTAEVCARLGKKREQLRRLRKSDFPEPIAELAATRVWDGDAIERWDRARKAGE